MVYHLLRHRHSHKYGLKLSNKLLHHHRIPRSNVDKLKSIYQQKLDYKPRVYEKLDTITKKLNELTTPSKSITESTGQGLIGKPKKISATKTKKSPVRRRRGLLRVV